MIRILLLVLLTYSASSQSLWRIPGHSPDGKYVRDSVRWQLEKVEYAGDSTKRCYWTAGYHEWYTSQSTAKPGLRCGVMHHGAHCDYDDRIENKICRKCLRKERWRERVYEHFEPYPKTEYERLDDSLTTILKEKQEEKLKKYDTMMTCCSADSVAYKGTRFVSDLIKQDTINQFIVDRVLFSMREIEKLWEQYLTESKESSQSIRKSVLKFIAWLKELK